MDDALVYHQAIISELVHLVREWLSSILESMDLYAALNLPVPHPGYPLPKGFPFNDCLTETFHWKHIYGQDEIAHGYRVLFKFRGVLAQQWSPLVWTITSGPYNDLGAVEIDARTCYDDPYPIFDLDAIFILESMMLSLRERSRIHLTSRVESQNAQVTLDNVEILELRTADGRLVRELGRRFVPRRQCATCHNWLPRIGPDVCLEHLFTAAGS